MKTGDNNTNSVCSLNFSRLKGQSVKRPLVNHSQSSPALQQRTLWLVSVEADLRSEHVLKLKPDSNSAEVLKTNLQQLQYKHLETLAEQILTTALAESFQNLLTLFCFFLKNKTGTLMIKLEAEKLL